MEGALLGVPSIAVSLAAPPPHDFVHAARLAASLGRSLIASRPARPVLLSLNVPAGPVRGWRLARLGKRTYGNEVVEKTDPRGRRYYWIGGEGGAVNHDIPGSDCNAVLDEGLASVTPLQLDATDDRAMEALSGLVLDGVAREPGP
jgi:5'-nucleotidase